MAGQNNKGLHNNKKLLTFRFSNIIISREALYHLKRCGVVEYFQY